MKHHSIHDLFTIGNRTGLEFNFEGNTYKVLDISKDDREKLTTLINDNLPIAYVRIQDDGSVRIRNPIETDSPTYFVDFSIELTDDYMVESERIQVSSKCRMRLFKDEIIRSINRLSIEKYGVHIVANWEDGGSDACPDDIHTTEDFLKAYPTANSRDVFDFMAGIRDGITVRTWVDDHNRLVCDTIYYVGEVITEKDELVYLIENDRHCVEVSLKVKSIFD